MTKVMGFTLVGLLVVAPMAAMAAPGNSGNGGNNGNHSGMGGGGSNGQGGGDGGRGGHGGHGGGHHGGGHGGGSHGGSSSPSVSQGGGTSAGGGALTIMGGQGISKGDRDKLIDAIKACEMVRPSLALGNHDVNGGWSFVTYDDTVWPYVQRCMAERGYPAQGIDYTNTSNFGTR